MSKLCKSQKMECKDKDYSPVLIIWGQLLENGSFDLVSPCWDLDFAGLLQESSEGNDEFLLVNVLYTNSWHVFGRI